ncbi:MAG: hypothetical protein WCQ72_02140 [Eubacteriales bacterium]
MKKMFTLLLCAVLLMSASCGSSDGGTTDITTAADTGTAEETAVTELSNSDIVKAKYSDADYGGYTFRVISPDPGKHFYYKASADENEIFFDSQTGDILHDSFYQRNLKTEEMLNIKIEPVWAGDSGDVTSTVKKNVLAGDNFADAIINRLDYTMNLSSEKLLANFYNIDTMSLSNEWWDENIVSGFTMFGDQLYALAGDIVIYDDYAVQALFGNKKLLSDLGYDTADIYQSVRDGGWTFAKFTEMVKNGVSDLNGDGEIKSADDQLGFSNHGGAVLHFLYPFGEKMSVISGDGTPSINYGSEHLTNVVQKIYDFLAEPDVIIDSNYTYIDNFKNGRVLFFADMIGTLTNMRTMENDFCVLPMFKEDEAQENYYAYVSNGWTTCYSVPITNSELSRTGVILETMSAISSDTVTPALYDVMLTQKFVRDTDSQEMLSYVWASKSYDLAGDLGWASSLRGVYEKLASASSNTYVSSMEKSLASIQKKLDSFLDSYRG